MGIDFVGGNKIVAQFDGTVQEKNIREVLSIKCQKLIANNLEVI